MGEGPKLDQNGQNDSLDDLFRAISSVDRRSSECRSTLREAPALDLFVGCYSLHQASPLVRSRTRRPAQPAAPQPPKPPQPLRSNVRCNESEDICTLNLQEATTTVMSDVMSRAPARAQAHLQPCSDSFASISLFGFRATCDDTCDILCTVSVISIYEYVWQHT